MAINFVTSDDVRILRDIELFYSAPTLLLLYRKPDQALTILTGTQIDEMPMNVSDLLS